MTPIPRTALASHSPEQASGWPQERRSGLQVVLLLLVLVPSLGQAQSRTATTIVSSAAVVTHGLDAVTTYRTLARNPHAVEGNPILAPFVGHPLAFTGVKLGAAVGIHYAILSMQKTKPKAAFYLALGEAIGVGIIAVHNARAGGRR